MGSGAWCKVSGRGWQTPCDRFWRAGLATKKRFLAVCAWLTLNPKPAVRVFRRRPLSLLSLSLMFCCFPWFWVLLPLLLHSQTPTRPQWRRPRRSQEYHGAEWRQVELEPQTPTRHSRSSRHHNRQKARLLVRAASLIMKLRMQAERINPGPVNPDPNCKSEIPKPTPKMDSYDSPLEKPLGEPLTEPWQKPSSLL